MTVSQIVNGIGSGLTVFRIPLVHLINQLLESLFCGGNTQLQIIQHREVGFHDAVKGILYGFLGVSGCRHNVGLGGDNFVGKFGGGLHIAAKGGFQAGSKSIHLLQIVVLAHLHGLVGVSRFLRHKIVSVAEHQLCATG